MPVHNGAAYIQEAALSLTRQTFADWELVLVDDGSTDRSSELAEEIIPASRLKIQRRERSAGVAESLNSALALATGPYIARLDCDDVAHPDRLRWQYEVLRGDPNLTATFGWYRFIDYRGRPLPTNALTGPLSERGLDPTLLLGNPLCHPAACFNQANGFPTEYPNHHYEDYSLWLSSISNWHVFVDPRVATYWRLHKGNQSRTRVKEGNNQLTAVFVAAAARQGFSIDVNVARAMLSPTNLSAPELINEAIATQRNIHQRILSASEDAACSIASRLQSSWILRTMAQLDRKTLLRMLPQLTASEVSGLGSVALGAALRRVRLLDRRA